MCFLWREKGRILTNLSLKRVQKIAAEPILPSISNNFVFADEYIFLALLRSMHCNSISKDSYQSLKKFP